MPATTTGSPFSLGVPSASSDLADLFGTYLKPNMTALNTYAAHKGTAQTFSALQTFSAGVTVSAGGMAINTSIDADVPLKVGTASATGQIGLHLTSTTGSHLQLTDQGNVDMSLGVLDGQSALSFHTGRNRTSAGTELMRLTSAGYVGIGTTTPDGLLGFKNTATFADKLVHFPLSTYTLYLRPTGTGGQLQMWSDQTNANVMTWTTAGNVGIGTSSPAYKLDVAGDIRLSNNTAVYWTDSTTVARRITVVASHIYHGDVDNAITGASLYLRSQASIISEVNAVSKFTINSTGTQTVGTNQATAHIATGLTGATTQVRYVGGVTGSTAPTTGTFALGDVVVGTGGVVFICTTAGTPGTWTSVGAASSTATFRWTMLLGGM